VSRTKYFQSSILTKTLTFLYDGFLDDDNVKDIGISHDSKANVIEPSDPGKQYIVICNFSVVYPSLPMPINKFMFKNIILILEQLSLPASTELASR